jgi:hypothetical protein
MDIDEKGPELSPEEEFLLQQIKEDGSERDNDMLEKLLSTARKKKDAIGKYLKKIDSHIHFAGKYLPTSYVPDFQEKLKQSQKFFLTSDFASNSLNKLATVETVIKAKEWFRLIHDPMWMEWNIPEKFESYRMGALLFTQGEKIMCYAVGGIYKDKSTNLFDLSLSELFPDTVRLEGDSYTLDIEDHEGRVISDMEFPLAHLAYDFVIRLNSPRITHFNPPEDLSRINKKRIRSGKAPLCVYQTVDLAKEIKLYLKDIDAAHVEGVRFHWRRGHFKVRKTGIFWWNPHSAGSKKYGEVVKDYVA